MATNRPLQDPRNESQPYIRGSGFRKIDEQTSLKSLIGKGEGGYNSSNRGTVKNKNSKGVTYDEILGSTHTTSRNGKALPEMTIGEIKALQRINDPYNTNRLFAVGKFQMVPDTFAEVVKGLGLPEDTIFNEQVQESMGDYLLYKKRPMLGAFLNNELYKGKVVTVEQAQNDMAKEWASIPLATRTLTGNGQWREAGTSYYGGANKSGHSAKSIRDSLLSSQKGYTGSRIEDIYKPPGSPQGDLPAVPVYSPRQTTEGGLPVEDYQKYYGNSNVTGTEVPPQQQQSFDRTFAAGRAAAGGDGGTFIWRGNEYNTNLAPVASPRPMPRPVVQSNLAPLTAGRPMPRPLDLVPPQNNDLEFNDGTPSVPVYAGVYSSLPEVTLLDLMNNGDDLAAQELVLRNDQDNSNDVRMGTQYPQTDMGGIQLGSTIMEPLPSLPQWNDIRPVAPPMQNTPNPPQTDMENTQAVATIMGLAGQGNAEGDAVPLLPLPFNDIPPNAPVPIVGQTDMENTQAVATIMGLAGQGRWLDAVPLLPLPFNEIPPNAPAPITGQTTMNDTKTRSTMAGRMGKAAADYETPPEITQWNDTRPNATGPKPPPSYGGANIGYGEGEVDPGLAAAAGLSRNIPPADTLEGINATINDRSTVTEDSIDKLAEKGNNDPKVPDDIKTKAAALLKNFFGLEGDDVKRALGLYLISRLSGASHEGSMRWAGGTVLKSAATRDATGVTLATKTAEDNKTIKALVDAGYTEASARSYVQTKEKDVLVKTGGQGRYNKTGNSTTLGITGIPGLGYVQGFEIDVGDDNGGKYNVFEVPTGNPGEFVDMTEQQLSAWVSKQGGKTRPYDSKVDTVAGRQQAAIDFTNSLRPDMNTMFSGEKYDKIRAEAPLAFAAAANFMQERMGYNFNDAGVQQDATVVLLAAMEDMRDDMASGRVKDVNNAAPYIKRAILSSASLGPGQTWLTGNGKNQVSATKTNGIWQSLENINKDPGAIKSNFIKLYQTYAAHKKDGKLPAVKVDNSEENEFYVWLHNTLGNEEARKAILGG